MKLSQTRTSRALETEGVWVAIRYGIEVHVSRIGNPRADVWRANLSAEDRRLLDNAREYTKMPVLYASQIRRVNELMQENLAHTVLNDWRHLEGDDGEPIPFSPEKALEIMREQDEQGRPLYDWFYADVLEAATSRETFFSREVREVGNASRKSSAGKGSTASD